MEISVGSVAVDVVPDTSRFATELKAKLKDITANIKVDADLTDLRAKLDEATHRRTATVEVNADTGAAEAQIDAVARDRHASIDIAGLGSVVAGVATLGAGVAALGPALIPITAAFAGIGAALVAPLALAGGGLTVGALVAGAAIADTKKQEKVLEQLQKRIETAKTAVANATTPAGKKSAMAQEAEATKAYQLALSQIPAAQRKFIEAQGRLKESFQKLLRVSGPVVFGPMIKAMDLLSGILPKLNPLLKGVSDGIGVLLDDVKQATTGPGFREFMASFGDGAKNAIVTFGRVFENIGRGIVGFFRAFAPLSKSFSGALVGASAAFAGWAKSLGSSKGFRSFLGYVREVGPKVASTIGDMFKALGNILTTVAPLGALSLAFADGLAKIIAAASPGQLAAIATGIGAIGVAVLFASGGVSGIVPAILGLGAGLSYAYGHSTKFREAVQSLADWFRERLLPALRDAWRTVLPGLTKGFDSIKKSLHDNQGLFRVLGDVVIPALAHLYRVELPLIGKAIGLTITGIRLFGNALLVMARVGLEAFQFLAIGALGAFGQIVDAAATGLGWLPGIGDKVKGAKRAFDNFRDNTVAALDVAIGKVKDLQTELNSIKPKPIRIPIKYTIPPAKTVQGVPLFTTTPEGAGARGAIINRPTVLLAGENGPERLQPLDQTPGNAPLPSGGGSAPMFNVEKVYAQDVNDFLRQMQMRSRLAGLSGGRA